MSASYSSEVANARSFLPFWGVLRIYRASLYKIVWRELLAFVVVYLFIQITTIWFLSESQQLYFKRMRDSFYINKGYIPTFLALGFFGMFVIDRWSVLQFSIPSADSISMLVSASVSGKSERSTLIRRTIVRYVIVSFILNLRMISTRMIDRFPTLLSIVEEGILLKNEEEVLGKMDEKNYATVYVVPLVWATNIVNRARREGLIDNDDSVQAILSEFGKYRTKLGDLLNYDNVCIPLVYTQSVTLAVNAYLFATLIAYQVICEKDVQYTEIVFSLIFAALEFAFHVGWLKVAEVLINPFGEDDNDFDVCRMLDRNIKAAYMIVDYMRLEEPVADFDLIYDYVDPNYLKSFTNYYNEIKEPYKEHNAPDYHEEIKKPVKEQNVPDYYEEIKEPVKVHNAPDYYEEIKQPVKEKNAPHVRVVFADVHV